MKTATDQLNLALINMAVRGERPRCADPITHEMWTSDDQADRDIAVLWCDGCVVLELCGNAADERSEKWQVFGGVDRTRQPRGKRVAA
jgi:hypothetical protein